MEEKRQMKIEDIRALCIEAHENAVKHGFWAEKHDVKHYLMLVITELAEAVQAYRKGRFFAWRITRTTSSRAYPKVRPLC